MKIGLRIILINVFLVFCLLPSANASLSSTFDSGDEGWRVWSSDPLDVNSFQWNSTGGYPGGYISAVDGEQGVTWWFVSPISWAGDWTQYIGGSIQWDILLKNAPDLVYFEQAEIIIDASDTGNYLTGEVNITPVLDQWVKFHIDINPENFTQVGTRDFYDIIANVDSILIRGEFITGPDSEGLDNVFVSLSTFNYFVLVSDHFYFEKDGSTQSMMRANVGKTNTTAYSVYLRGLEGVGIYTQLVDYLQWSPTSFEYYKVFLEEDGWPAPGSFYEGKNIQAFADSNNDGSISAEVFINKNYPTGTFKELDFVSNVKVFQRGYDTIVTWDGTPEATYYVVRAYDSELNFLPNYDSESIYKNSEDKYFYNMGNKKNLGLFNVAIEARQYIDGLGTVNRSTYFIEYDASTVLDAMTEKIVWESDRAGNYDIYMMNPDGSNKVQLTNNTADDKNPTISPDGTRIAFESKRTGESEIWIMDTDGETKTRLTNGGGYRPIWSLNGTKIYYNGPDPYEVSVINLDGTNYQYIGLLGHDLSISPDGNRFVYCPQATPEPNSYNVYTAAKDGTNNVNLSAIASLSGYERPNGKNAWGSNGKILFQAQEPSWINTTDYDIWYVMQDGSESGPILDEDNQNNGSPGWSPDELKITFCSKRMTGDYNIWTMNSDGTDLQQLTNDLSNDTNPHWGMVKVTIPPTIDPISDHSALEGEVYTSPTPTLSQGTQPVVWSIDIGPTGLTIDASTGVVTWLNPTATGSPHSITIRATNSKDFDTESWLLNVPVIGPIGNWLNLDGQNDYAFAPNSDSLNLSGNQLTMEAWVKLGGPTGNHWILCKQDIDDNRSYGFYIDSNSRKIVPSIHADWFFEGEVGDGVLEYNAWYHVAVVYDGSLIKTYINGVFNGEAELTGNLVTNQRELIIGGTYWNFEDATNGSIDEVRIWDLARTQSDIQTTMDRNLTGLEDGLVGFWQFEAMEDMGANDDGADDYRDLSTNGNHLDMLYFSQLSGTITGLSTGQYINIHANSDNGTPEDGSDDINYGVGVSGSGSGSDSFSLTVAATAGYRIEFNPENAVRVFYKENAASGVYNQNDATLIDATNEVTGIDVTITTGSIVSGTIIGLTEGQAMWIGARNTNGTLENWDDDFWFGTDIIGSGAGNDSYAMHVAPLTHYVVEANAEGGVYVYYDGTQYGTFRWQDAAMVDATSDVSDVDIAISMASFISGTITGLASGQPINIYAGYDNGTPEDPSDDFGFGTNITGSGTGTDLYNLAVAPLDRYRVEFNADDAGIVFYRVDNPYGTSLWENASLVNAVNDVNSISINLYKDSDNDGLNDFEEAGYGTYPNDPDSDGDGFSDGYEVSVGTGPNAPGEYPSITPIYLDGYADYAWSPDSGTLNITGNQVTMEAMVRLVGPTGNHWIVSKQNIDNNRSYGFYISAASRKIVPSIHADWHFEGEVGDGILEYDTWYHVAVVYDGSQINTYINGLFNGEANLTGNMVTNQRELTIGGTYWSPEDTTNGSIDDVRIWNIARSQMDIKDTFGISLSGSEAGLVGYWQFDVKEDLGVGGDGVDDFRDFSLSENHADLAYTLDTNKPDFDKNSVIDGMDLSHFLQDFGRIDCNGDCLGDFEPDGDVDQDDLAVFAANFGKVGVPVYLDL